MADPMLALLAREAVLAVKSAGRTLGAFDDYGERKPIRPRDMTPFQARFLWGMHGDRTPKDVFNNVVQTSHLRALYGDKGDPILPVLSIAGGLGKLDEAGLIELAFLLREEGRFIAELPEPMQALVALVPSPHPYAGPPDERAVERARWAQALYNDDPVIAARAKEGSLKHEHDAPPGPGNPKKRLGKHKELRCVERRRSRASRRAA